MRKVAESRDIIIFERNDSHYEVRRKLNGFLLVKTADLADAYNELRYYQDDRDFRKKISLARLMRAIISGDSRGVFTSDGFRLRQASFDE